MGAVIAITIKATAPAVEIRLRVQPISDSHRGITRLNRARADADRAIAIKP
jgi:hypothetical protein